MAETSGSLRLAVLRRIRDPNGTAHASFDVWAVLTHAQRLVNIQTHAVTAQTIITRTAEQPLVSTILMPVVLSVQFGSRFLPQIDWQTLVHNDPDWLRRTGVPQVWGMIGRTILCVYPAPPTGGDTITITHVLVTNALTGDNDPIVLPDNYAPSILDIAEESLLARQRLFGSFKAASERQQQRGRMGVAAS